MAKNVFFVNKQSLEILIKHFFRFFSKHISELLPSDDELDDKKAMFVNQKSPVFANFYVKYKFNEMFSFMAIDFHCAFYFKIYCTK